MFTQMPNFAEGGFEFLRKLWSGGLAGMAGSGMPNMANFAAPPMDLEELDKRIHDLRAVEGWLQLNASLLRTAIQGLEVQRATLVALQTFGSALTPDAMKTAFDGLTPAASKPDSESKPAWPHSAATAKSAEDEAPEPEPEDEAEVEAEDTDDDQAEARAENAQNAQAQAAAHAQAAARAAAAALDPSPWWNMLQQQFNQIASSAAAAMPMPQNLMPGFPGGFPGFGGAPGAEGLDTAPEDIEEPTARAKSKPTATKSAAKPKPAAKKAPAGKTAKPATKTAAKKAPAKSPAPKPDNDTP